MDFRDTPEEAEFRTEAADWIERTLPGRPVEEPTDQEGDLRNRRWWQEQLHEGGWAGITWPEEYGGRGLTVVHEAIFNEEASKREAPGPLNFLGMILAGPTILAHGTDEQKERLLPRILSGEEIWCQGFSEPDAGSDLASLSSRAARADGGWVVNGQKVWTSYAHVADRCMLLARVDEGDDGGSKHAGITYFLAEMDDVEVRPLVMTNGERDFNEMFLSDVFVGDEDVLGDVGAGWPIALTTLAFERGSLAFALAVIARRALDGLIDRAVGTGADADPTTRDHIGGFEADLRALRLTSVRQLSEVSAGRMPGAEGSAVKLAWAHLMQGITRLAVEIGGPTAVTTDGAEDRRWTDGYLRSRGNSIEGGTDEIQRSIIAERVLGLPRSR